MVKVTGSSPVTPTKAFCEAKSLTLEIFLQGGLFYPPKAVKATSIAFCKAKSLEVPSIDKKILSVGGFCFALARISFAPPRAQNLSKKVFDNEMCGIIITIENLFAGKRALLAFSSNRQKSLLQNI